MTILEHCWSYHLRQQCQDHIEHQGQQGSLFFQQQDIIDPCLEGDSR